MCPGLFACLPLLIFPLSPDMPKGCSPLSAEVSPPQCCEKTIWTAAVHFRIGKKKENTSHASFLAPMEEKPKAAMPWSSWDGFLVPEVSGLPPTPMPPGPDTAPQCWPQRPRQINLSRCSAENKGPFQRLLGRKKPPCWLQNGFPGWQYLVTVRSVISEEAPQKGG